MIPRCPGYKVPPKTLGGQACASDLPRSCMGRGFYALRMGSRCIMVVFVEVGVKMPH